MKKHWAPKIERISNDKLKLEEQFVDQAVNLEKDVVFLLWKTQERSHSPKTKKG